jgi:hypothetical protein
VPAVVPAIIPNIAAWGQTQVDGALNAARISMAQIGPKSLWARAFSTKVWRCWVAARALRDGARGNRRVYVYIDRQF